MVILAALMLSAAAPAAPVEGAALDLRCLLLSGEMRRSENPSFREAGEAASYYFFGRVDGQIADGDLENRIWQESRLMRAEDRQSTMQACGLVMQQRGQRLIEIGTRLGEREREEQPQE